MGPLRLRTSEMMMLAIAGGCSAFLLWMLAGELAGDDKSIGDGVRLEAARGAFHEPPAVAAGAELLTVCECHCAQYPAVIEPARETLPADGDGSASTPEVTSVAESFAKARRLSRTRAAPLRFTFNYHVKPIASERGRGPESGAR